MPSEVDPVRQAAAGKLRRERKKPERESREDPVVPTRALHRISLPDQRGPVQTVVDEPTRIRHNFPLTKTGVRHRFSRFADLSVVDAFVLAYAGSFGSSSAASSTDPSRVSWKCRCWIGVTHSTSSWSPGTCARWFIVPTTDQ
jgi:hypothetical protein